MQHKSTTAKESTAAHYHEHRRRLREKYVQKGLGAFSDYEVVEFLLMLCIPRRDVKDTAKRLLSRFGNLRGIFNASLDDLQDIDGIGAVSPVAIHFIRDIALLSQQQAAEERDSFLEPTVLERFWRERIGSLPNEVFEVGYLDGSYRLLRDGIERLEEGTIDRASVYPRRVAEAALWRKAATVVFAHNHPNGVCDPTDHDKALTRALVLAANAVQVKVLDHIIVSADSVFSFREEGLL